MVAPAVRRGYGSGDPAYGDPGLVALEGPRSLPSQPGGTASTFALPPRGVLQLGSLHGWTSLFQDREVSHVITAIILSVYLKNLLCYLLKHI